MDKPSVFVGSSSEGLEVARAIQVQLADVSQAELWNESVLALSYGTLESLVQASDRFDFAVLVLTGDDLIVSRDVQQNAARDNVLIEFGLFTGSLGRERTFLLCCKDDNIKIPSNLAGMTFETFSRPSDDSKLITAVGPACVKIRTLIRKKGKADELGRLTRVVETQEQRTHDLESSITDILMSTVLDAYEYITLLKITGAEQNPGYLFSRDKGQALLERLKNRGLIEEGGNDSIFKNNTDRWIDNIKDHFIISKQGQKFLDAIDSRGLGDALKKIALAE
jgi:hypothetical protein